MRSRLRFGLRFGLVGIRLAAAGLAVARLAKVAKAARPVSAGRASSPPTPQISIVIPARDEVDRLGPLLDTIVGATGVDEVIVVDDQSSDGTAELAQRLGARVL